MTITWQHMSAALLTAFALHSGIALWLTLPEPQPAPPEQTLRVSLLATIAESTTAAEPVTPPPQKNTSPATPPKPRPKPEPVVQKPEPPPEPVTEPIPQPEPLPFEPPAEIMEAATPVAEPVAEPEPIEPTPAPLSATAAAEYEQLLVAWLEKQKKYPKRAKRLRIEGEGLLRILIDRSGQTQKVTLEQRTGNRLLDKAVLEMAARATPFPPMPENDLRQTLEFIVPIVFALR